MVHQVCPLISPSGFVDLALVPIHIQHLIPHGQPRPACIKPVLLSVRYKLGQPTQKRLIHCPARKTAGRLLPAVALSNYLNCIQYTSLYPRTTRIFNPQPSLLRKKPPRPGLTVLFRRPRLSRGAPSHSDRVSFFFPRPLPRFLRGHRDLLRPQGCIAKPAEVISLRA